jgi:hypothetical protein
MKVAIINCVNQKHQTATLAKDLYTSISFRAKRAFVEAKYDKWFIFSLKYGIIEPNTIVEPYNISLGLNNRNNFKCEVVDVTALTELCKQQLKNISGDIDCHMPLNYYKMIKQGKWIKQPTNQSLAFDRYTQAINLDLDDALQLIQAPKPHNPEPYHNWIHPEYGEFYGRSYDLVHNYPELKLDEADARKVGFGKNKTHKGWAVKKGAV